MGLIIVTDGTVDMPDAWSQQFNIKILPFKIAFGNKTYVQGKDLDRKGFYRIVNESRTVPKTTLLNPYEIESFYRQIAKPGDDVISIHVSAKMSGTYESAQRAAQQVSDIYNVYPFDSASGSAALGFMCREARIMHENGCSLEKILTRLDEIRRNIYIVLTLDTLEFAYLNGRINAIQTAVTSILRIKPVVVLSNGLLQMSDRVQTRKKSIECIIGKVLERFGKKLLNIAVVHAEDLPTAEYIAEFIGNKLNCHEILITDLSISVAANLGPRTVGIVAYPI